MLTDFADYLLTITDTSRDFVNTMLLMVIIPMLYVLRGVACIGLLYPFYLGMKRIFYHSRKTAESLVLILGWVTINMIFFTSNISTYFWVIGDITGLFIVLYLIIHFIEKRNINLYKQFKKTH